MGEESPRNVGNDADRRKFRRVARLLGVNVSVASVVEGAASERQAVDVSAGGVRNRAKE